MNCSNNVKENRTRLEFPSKNFKAKKKMRAQYDTLSLAFWDSKQSPPHQACWASHLAQYETMNLCCELLCLGWFAAADTGKSFTQNCCYHRNVVISVSAKRELLHAQGGVGEAYLTHLIILCQKPWKYDTFDRNCVFRTISKRWRFDKSW